MALSGWLTLIEGVLKFPKELLALIMVLKSTPEEKRAELVAKNQAWGKSFEDTGRPPE